MISAGDFRNGITVEIEGNAIVRIPFSFAIASECR